MRSRRTPDTWMLVLLALLISAAAHAETAWYAGGGVEFPSVGRGGHLSKLHEQGTTFAVGADQGLSGTTGALMRIAFTSFPPDRANAAALGFADVSDASLTTAVAGLRFRRRDLAFSPYFDLGLGAGWIHVRRIAASPAVGASDEETSFGLVWTWGTGIAWRATEHYGVFADAHWDTGPGGSHDTSWTAALRAGLERR